MYHEAKRQFRPAVFLSVGAAFVSLGLWYLGKTPRTCIDVFLWIEGGVLMGCSQQPDDPLLWKSWKGWLFGSDLAGPVTFIPGFYRLGLLLLSAAAILGAFLP